MGVLCSRGRGIGLALCRPVSDQSFAQIRQLGFCTALFVRSAIAFTGLIRQTKKSTGNEGGFEARVFQETTDRVAIQENSSA